MTKVQNSKQNMENVAFKTKQTQKQKYTTLLYEMVNEKSVCFFMNTQHFATSAVYILTVDEQFLFQVLHS